MALESEFTKHDWHDHIESDPRILNGKGNRRQMQELSVIGSKEINTVVLSYTRDAAPCWMRCGGRRLIGTEDLSTSWDAK